MLCPFLKYSKKFIGDVISVITCKCMFLFIESSRSVRFNNLMEVRQLTGEWLPRKLKFCIISEDVALP